MASAFFEEILQQPAALHDLIHYYQSSEGRERLYPLHRPKQVLLSGMGASFHAAYYGALLFGSRGIPAIAIEATDLLHFNMALLSQTDLLIFISQSGSSAEVIPLLERLPATTNLVAITNHADSPLGRGAQYLLPQNAGIETTVATKTYLNTLACLWLLAQHWGTADAFAALSRITDAVQKLIDGRDALIAEWFEALYPCDRLIFLGHGSHQSTARQSAMMLAEWAKYSALCFGIGAFRHGFIEIVIPQTRLVMYGKSGGTGASVRGLVDEVTRYGARALSIVNGLSHTDGAQDADDFLAPLLDVIPAQLFAEFMAQHLKVEPGFRYIQKVVRQL